MLLRRGMGGGGVVLRGVGTGGVAVIVVVTGAITGGGRSGVGVDSFLRLSSRR